MDVCISCIMTSVYRQEARLERMLYHRKEKTDTIYTMKYRIPFTISVFFLSIILLITASPAFAQQTGGEPVFFPFISSLRVASRDTSIRLTWRDVPDYEGSYLVYRHTAVIDENSISSAVLVASVPQGEEVHTDIPPTSGDYYYAILTEQNDSSPLAVFIPFRNQTVRPITIVSTEKEEAPLAGGIYAAAQRNQIAVSFDPAPYEVALVRSSTAMNEPEDVNNATLIGLYEGDQTVIYDTPPAGVAYYYGIFNANLLGTDELVVEPDNNVTLLPVALELSQDPQTNSTNAAAISIDRVALPEIARNSRINPLPLLQGQFIASSPYAYLRGQEEGQELAAETLAALDKIGAFEDRQNTIPQEAVLLPDSYSLQYNASSLQNIVQRAVSERRWHQAYDQLTDLLNTPISADMAKHIHFYRGQALLHLDQPTEAFFELLSVRGDFFVESSQLIDVALQQIANKSSDQ